MMKHSLNDSKGKIGYELIFFLLGLGFMILFFWPPLKYSANQIDRTANVCYIDNPNPDHDLVYRNNTYQELRLNTPVVSEEIKAHLEDYGVATDSAGKSHKAYIPTIDMINSPNNNGGYEVERQEDLLLLDVSASASGTLYRTLNVYRKKGTKIPDYIIKFCDENKDLGAYPLFRDQDGNSYPPSTINTNDIHDLQSGTAQQLINFCNTIIDCNLPPNKKYYLFSYEKFTRRAGFDPYGVGGWSYFGKISVLRNGKMQTDPMSFNPASTIKMIALFSPDMKYQFNYIPEDLVPNPKEVTNFEENYKDPNWNDYSLQLRAMRPVMINPWGWWTPECKPAIYLYPKTKAQISVQLNPKGIINYLDPKFNIQNGWSVTAYPSGNIEFLEPVLGSSKDAKLALLNYPYLYYESKLYDQNIKKPTEGFIVKKAALEEFYKNTLPKLGLNQKEMNDYIEYWTKYLPASDQYFIGIMDTQNIEYLEPLTITPQPQKIIRVRLYYQMLTNQEAQNLAPIIKQPYIQEITNRTSDFTVIEWGGMVKRDQTHPFTCSQ